MSFSLYLLCESDIPISRAEVTSFIEDGSYFDSRPAFEPGVTRELGELTIKVASGETVKLKKLSGEDAEAALAEALESLDSAPIADAHRERLEASLQGTRSVVEIEIHRAAMTKETWAMLDALEADILRSRQGLLYVYGEGVYGPDLKLWPGGAGF